MHRTLSRCLRALGLVLAVAGLWGLPACRKSDAADAKPPLKTVRVSVVGRADIEHVLSYPADLKPSSEVRIFSRVYDRILSFPWDDGDEIRRGKRIAVIRTTGLSHGLEQVAAQADALDVQIDNQKSELRRVEQLLAKGVVAQAEFDRLQTSTRAAEAQRRALTASQGQLAASASDGVITAPIDGVIADKMLQSGDIAAPTVPLCRIVNVENLKVELRLVEADVPKVKLGQEALLYLDAYPKRTFRGEVSRILPYLDQQTRTNTVEITVPNPKDSETGEHALKPGMYGRAELVVERRAQVVVVPEPALVLDNQVLAKQAPGESLRKAFVVDSGGKVHKRIVKVGARKGSLCQILEGISTGERIVVRGQHELKDGERVEVVAEAKGQQD
jgi:membrane fusion protein (multidrug efflux system)